MAVSQNELRIIVRSQDLASQQLRQISGAVQQLDRQVASLGRSQAGRGGLLGGLLQGGAIGVGMQALQGALSGIGQVAGFVGESIFGMNSRLEQATATFRAFTGSAGAAQQIVAMLQREADITPFDTEEVVRAGQALISVAGRSQEALLGLVRTAEVLAALRPEQGLEGAAIALREATEGNLQSIQERFGITAGAINRFREQGMTAMQAVRAEMQRMGLDSRLVQELARTFPGLLSNVLSFANQVRQRLGAGLFDRAKEALVAINNLLTQYRDRLLAFASQVGQFVAALAGRLAQALGAALRPLMNALAPGLWDELARGARQTQEALAETGQAAEDMTPAVREAQRALTFPEAQEALRGAGNDMQRLQQLATDTAAPVRDINRELGALGVAAGELQIGADRVRRDYEAQLRPLQRQLELLQDNIDLQRVQSQLAASRAQTERQRLQAELAALQRAGAAEDPDAPDLTPRQRAIALAAQERRLRLEELNLTEQQRPAVQSLEERIKSLQRAQQDALAPSERQLEVYRDRVDVLNVERQRWENLKGTIQETIDAVQATPIKVPIQGPSDADVAQAQADARKRGEELADGLLKGWNDWLKAGGGTIGGAISKSLNDWYEATGKPTAERIGKALGEGIAASLTEAFEKWLRQNPVLDALLRTAAVATGNPLPVAAPEPPRRTVDPATGRTAPVGLPQNLPRGSGVPLVSPEAQAAAAPPPPPAPPVSVGDVTVNVEGVSDPEQAARLKQALTDFLTGFIQSGMTTQPGAQAPVAGNTR